jgi:hypothetical protein
LLLLKLGESKMGRKVTQLSSGEPMKLRGGYGNAQFAMQILRVD